MRSFGKTAGGFFDEAVIVSLNLRQPWGSVGVTIHGSHLVRGDESEVTGESYVLIYDDQRRLDSGGRSYAPAPGDRYNLKTREATPPSTTPQPVERVIQKRSIPHQGGPQPAPGPLWGARGRVGVPRPCAWSPDSTTAAQATGTVHLFQRLAAAARSGVPGSVTDRTIRAVSRNAFQPRRRGALSPCGSSSSRALHLRRLRTPVGQRAARQAGAITPPPTREL